jgi:hypothetical protein
MNPLHGLNFATGSGWPETPLNKLRVKVYHSRTRHRAEILRLLALPGGIPARGELDRIFNRAKKLLEEKCN